MIPRVPLGDICEFVYGESLIEQCRRSGRFPVYGSNGIVGWHDESICRGPTIIIGRKGSIGEVHYSAGDCYPIDTTYYIEAARVQCDLRWLYFTLLKLDLSRFNKSAAVPGLNREDAYEKLIPLPELRQQKRIAGILEQADRLRRIRRYSLELGESWLGTAFTVIFGSPSEAFKRWPVFSLDSCCKRITDGTHLTPEFFREGVPFIFVKNIKNAHIDFKTDKFIPEEVYNELYSRCPVEEDDILYTIVGATYGQAALVRKFTKFAFQRHIAHIKANSKPVLPKFLVSVMQLPIVKAQADRWARGAAQPTINLKELREFLVPAPPLSLQQAFVGLVDRVERLRAVHREALRQAEHLFQTLLHRAFTTGL